MLGFESARMLQVRMQCAREGSAATSPANELIADKAVAAAVIAITTHVAASAPEILADINESPGLLRRIGSAVDLTEAPEDAVATLLVDLMYYCEREKISWSAEIGRAKDQFDRERRAKLNLIE